MREKWYQESDNQFAIFVVIVVTIGLVGLWLLFGVMDYAAHSNLCYGKSGFECQDIQVRECLKSEQYTKDQCVILIGGAK